MDYSRSAPMGARLDAMIAAAEADTLGLKREMGPLSLAALGIATIIGAGIFVLSGDAASQFAGPGVVLSFAIAGIAAAFSALCYAELVSMIPVSGSTYVFAYASLGNFLAWVIGWDLLLEYLLGGSAIAAGWAGYFGNVLGHIGITLPNAITGGPFGGGGGRQPAGRVRRGPGHLGPPRRSARVRARDELARRPEARGAGSVRGRRRVLHLLRQPPPVRATQHRPLRGVRVERRGAGGGRRVLRLHRVRRRLHRDPGGAEPPAHGPDRAARRPRRGDGALHRDEVSGAFVDHPCRREPIRTALARAPVAVESGSNASERSA